MNQENPSAVGASQPTGTDAPDASDASSTAATAPEPATRAPRRGRPRDPLLDERALRATLEVFGEKGWTGLTYDEVAARAKVGKSSLYLRWPTKERLLADALRRTQDSTSVSTSSDGASQDSGSPDSTLSDSASRRARQQPAAVRPSHGEVSAEADADPRAGGEEGSTADVSLRTYLVDHAMRRAELYVGEHGLAMLRLYVEARALPEVFAEIQKEAITSFVLAQRHRVEDAIAEGDLSEGASVVQLLDAIEGAVLMHVLVTPPELTARMRLTLPEYVETLVDTQLRAAGGPGADAPGPPSAG